MNFEGIEPMVNSNKRKDREAICTDTRLTSKQILKLFNDYKSSCSYKIKDYIEKSNTLISCPQQVINIFNTGHEELRNRLGKRIQQLNEGDENLLFEDKDAKLVYLKLKL